MKFCLHDWGDIASSIGVLFVFWTFLALVPISFTRWAGRDRGGRL